MHEMTFLKQLLILSHAGLLGSKEIDVNKMSLKIQSQHNNIPQELEPLIYFTKELVTSESNADEDIFNKERMFCKERTFI